LADGILSTGLDIIIIFVLRTVTFTFGEERAVKWEVVVGPFSYSFCFGLRWLDTAFPWLGLTGHPSPGASSRAFPKRHQAAALQISDAIKSPATTYFKHNTRPDYIDPKTWIRVKREHIATSPAIGTS